MKNNQIVFKKIISYTILIALMFNININFAYALTYETDRIEPDGYAGNNILFKNIDAISSLSSINWEVLKNNGYDDKKIEEWVKIGEALLKSKEENNELWKEYEENQNKITPNIAKTLGINYDLISRYDIRTLESLIYLTAPKHNGGAGREYLQIPTITQGYNVISSNKSTLKDKTAKEADGFNIAKDENALEYLSAHGKDWAQAIDISAIDYIRGTILIYDKDDKLVDKKKIDKKIPIAVEWQTDYRPEDGNNAYSLAKPRDLLSKSIIDGLFKTNINLVFNSLTSNLLSNSELGIEMPQTNINLTSDNLAQMIANNIGLTSILNENNLPTDFVPGYDLAQTGINLGNNIIEKLSGGNIPETGFYGENLYELETNIGREWIAKQMGLPEKSLISANSHELLESIGKAIIEDKFNMRRGSLNNFDSDFSLSLGKGYIEKQLNLAPDSFSKNSFDEIKFAIGNEKANYLFASASLIDKILGIPIGNTEKLKSNSLKPNEYAKIVGETKVNEFKSAFKETKYYDALFGVSLGGENFAVFGDDNNKKLDWILKNYKINDEEIANPDTGKKQKAIDYLKENFSIKYASNQALLNSWLTRYAQRINPNQEDSTQNIVEKLLSGDKNIFYTIGKRTLVKSLSQDDNAWNYLSDWLNQESDSNINNLMDIKDIKLNNQGDINAIYPDYLNKKFDFSYGDIERMFILDRADEVFTRIGTIKLLDGLDGKKYTDDNEFTKKTENDSVYYSDYYQNKIEEIRDSNSFKALAKNIQTNKEIQRINQLFDQIVSYKEINKQNIEQKTRIRDFSIYFDQIGYEFQSIRNRAVDTADVEVLRNYINEIIEGHDIADPKNYKEGNIKENYLNYYIVYGTYKEILDVINNKIKAKDFSKKIGFQQLSNTILQHPDENILESANSKVIQNYQNSNTILNQTVGEEFTGIAKDIINDTYSMEDNNLKLSNEDLIAFLNGAVLPMQAKIGSQIMDKSYGINSTFNYIKGNLSAEELSNQSELLKNSDNPQITVAKGLFSENANIHNLGMQATDLALGLNISDFYNNPNFNANDTNNTFLDGLFSKVNMDAESKQNINADITKYLSNGNIIGLINRIEANTLAKTYQQIHPDLPFTYADFIPPADMKILTDFINQGKNSQELKTIGFFASLMQEANYEVAIKPVKYAIMDSLKKSFPETNIDAINNFVSGVFKQNTSQQETKKIFSDFLLNSNIIKDIPQEYKDAFTSFISGNANPSDISNLITNVWLKDETDETKKIISGVFSLANQNGNIDPTSMLNALKTMGVNIDKNMEGAISLLGSLQNGNFNASNIFSTLNSLGLLNNLSSAEKDKLMNQLGLLNVFNGDLNGGSILNFLQTNTTIFNSLSNNQLSALTGVLNIGLSGGNISPQQIAALGMQYFGMSNIAIGNWGVISPGALIGAINNPMGLVTNLLSQYISNALLGSLATGFVGAIATALITSLVSSLFGGQGRIEYHWTACGYYPTYDQEQTIEGKKFENELKIVNDAKAKAVSEDTAEAWGAYITARTKYDAIPTDEIEEDDMQTKDEKYSDIALDNEQSKIIQEENLSDVVTWAKTKDNKTIKCMDKINGGGGVFVNDNNPDLTKEQKKQMAKYKIKVMLGNLLYMRDRTAITNTDNYLEINENLAINNKENNTNNYILNIISPVFAQEDYVINQESAKQIHDYTRKFRFNTSGLDLRPTQIMTYGSDTAQGKSSIDASSILGTESTLVTPDLPNDYMANNEKTNLFADLKYLINSKAKAQTVSSFDYRKNDVSHFYVTRDRLWGDQYGSPGSQDINLADGLLREGFGFNDKMYDRIHYGY